MLPTIVWQDDYIAMVDCRKRPAGVHRLQETATTSPSNQHYGDRRRPGSVDVMTRRTLTTACELARLANMIVVNMHEAKSRLSELVKGVEERNEVVILCRDGQEVAEIRRRSTRRRVRSLTPDPLLQVQYAPGFSPTEPLTGDEWPEDQR